jgi:hypothetical protein
MILPSLAAAATSSGRSFAGWAYDVSKSVASAIVVAFGIAVVGKSIGWGTFTRLRWRVLWGFAALVVFEMLIIAGAILSGVPNSPGDVFSWLFLIAVGCFIVAIFLHTEFLEPPPPPVVTSSHLDSAARSDER